MVMHVLWVNESTLTKMLYACCTHSCCLTALIMYICCRRNAAIKCMLHTEKLKQHLTCATYVHMRDACVHKKACHMCAFSCMLYMRSGMYATHELCTLLLACCMPVAHFNFCVCGTQVRFCVLLICSYMYATHKF